MEMEKRGLPENINYFSFLTSENRAMLGPMILHKLIVFALVDSAKAGVAVDNWVIKTFS
ncbi:MAG TPA: hypothetical protein VHE53_01855 [Patescibacteria group bacterium]|nr:hypothetical protein [Patescibacteria group bacterium]